MTDVVGDMSGNDNDEILYTPLFCEENIWHLARRMLQLGVAADSLQVLLFSNPDKQVVMFNQRNVGEQGYVVWDYHVVLQAGELIYDLDSMLPFPVPVADYFRASFPNQFSLAEMYRSQVRCIPAMAFVENFYSNRLHMQGLIADDDYPAWPAIMPSHEQKILLSEYWDMQQSLTDGSEVLSVAEYMQQLDPER